MATGELSIGDLSRETDVKIPTIRYYETINLMPPARRTENGRRIYEPEDVRRLRFIRHARDLGFDIEPIRTLLALQDDPDQSCEECDAVARARLTDVEERIERLESLRTELRRMIESTQHGKVAECRVIEVLADHALCSVPSH